MASPRRSLDISSSRSRPRLVAAGDDPVPQLLFTPEADPYLEHLLRSGRTIAFGSRDSGEGTSAHALAVDGLWNAAGDVRANGIDVFPLLESIGKSDFRRRLREESVKKVSKDIDGAVFTNRFLVIEDFLDQGVVIWLSSGSGRKHDKNLDQPAADHLVSEVLLAYRPAALTANLIARLTRSSSGITKIMSGLKEIRRTTNDKVFVGDHGLPLQELTQAVENHLFHEALTSEAEANRLAYRSLQGLHNNTATEMEHGQAVYASNVAVYPGLATGRVRSPESGSTVRMLWVDSPQYRPAAAALRSFHNPVQELDGSPAVDQAELVCWFFDHYLTEGWTQKACADHLRAHGFCTEALRRLRNDPFARFERSGARWDSREDQRLLRSMLTHIEDYRHARFRFKIPNTDKHHTLTGVTPARGHWIDEDSYRRITGILATRADTSRPSSAAYVWSWVPVQINGRPAALKGRTRGTSVIYSLASQDPDTRRGGARAGATTVVHAQTLTTMIVRAFLDSDAQLPRLVADPTRADQIARDLARVEHDLQAARSEREAWGELRDSSDLEVARLRKRAEQSGTRRDADALSGAQQALARRGAKLREFQATTDDLAREVAELGRALAIATGPSELGIADTDLLTLVAELANPRSAVAHAFIRANVRNFAITCEPDPDADRPGWLLATITAELLVRSSGGDTFVLPMTAREYTGRGPDTAQRIRQAVVDLYDIDGSLPDTWIGSSWAQFHGDIGRILGLAPGQSQRLVDARDGRIRSLGLAVCHPLLPEPQPDPERPYVLRLAGPALDDDGLRRLARSRHEPIALLRRPRTLYEPGSTLRPKWLQQESSVAAAAYAQARRRRGLCPPDAVRTDSLLKTRFGEEWARTESGLRLQPCRGCGTTNRVPLRIHEADGSVCTRCRTDRSGVI